MTTPTTGAAELPEALPRYREYMHLRTTGAWSSGVPAWARDYSGCMNDMTAAHAVIEELHAQVEALSAAQAGAPVIPAMMYLMLTDAMGYDSGEDGTTWSPEEWAAHLYSFYKSKTAPAQPGQEGEPVAWLSVDCIGERYLCFTRPDDDDPVRPLVFGDTAPPTHDQETPASIAVAAARKMLKEET